MDNTYKINQRELSIHHEQHLCLIYDVDPMEQMPALIPFIKEGLDKNERFVYIADDITVEQLSQVLNTNGIDVEEECNRGALKLWTKKEWRQSGELNAEKKSRQVRGFIKDAISDGFDGIRFAVEMTWTLGPDISVEKLERWEAAINTIISPDVPVKIICQYSRLKLPPSVINQAFRTHPSAIIDNCLCSNVFYEKPHTSNEKAEAEITVDMMARIKKGYLGEKAMNNNNKIDFKDIDWGTHLCHFYENKEDLAGILVPYIKAGLENNELCMWITSKPLRNAEAFQILKQDVPDLETYIEMGQLEIIDAKNWYLRDNKLKPLEEIIESWSNKLHDALNNGFHGMRVTGNTYWLEKKDWESFYEYENQINERINQYRMIALCSYNLGKCSPSDIIDVVSNHQGTFIIKNGKISIIENREHRRAENMLVKAFRQLENSVRNRTSELTKSLHEKEILLQEIHHRVKNNMQVISSILKLQASYLEGEEIISRVFKECQNRIQSMALVHESLYEADDLSTLNIQEYINSLGAELLRAYNQQSSNIKLDIDVKNVFLDMDTSITCGLIISELMANSIKYAFKDEKQGNIRVSMHTRQNTARLKISDDGVGLHKGFDIVQSKTLGIKLVNTLIAQLDGKLEVSKGQGITYNIEFPVPPKKLSYEKTKYSYS